MEIILLVCGLIALGLLAHRFGYDSRDGFGVMSRDVSAATTGWSNMFHDRELARVTLAARQRRLTRSEAVNAQLAPVEDDLLHAA